MGPRNMIPPVIVWLAPANMARTVSSATVNCCAAADAARYDCGSAKFSLRRRHNRHRSQKTPPTPRALTQSFFLKGSSKVRTNPTLGQLAACNRNVSPRLSLYVDRCFCSGRSGGRTRHC